jgi:hypothetical protein
LYAREEKEIKVIVAAKVVHAQEESLDRDIDEDTPCTPQQYQE